MWGVPQRVAGTGVHAIRCGPMAAPGKREVRRERKTRSHWKNARLESDEPEQIMAAAPGEEEVRAVASRCGVLADPTRLQVLSVVRAAGEICVSDLEMLTEIERSVISHHLSRSRKVGLTKSRPEGKLVMHSLTRAGSEMLDAVMPE